MDGKKTLIVYYSHTGNTRALAEAIKDIGGGDLAALIPETPYEEEGRALLDLAAREVREGAFRPAKPLMMDPASYERIVVGSPTWWYAPAPVVRTFLQGIDGTGKEIIPFATHGGGPGDVLFRMGEAMPDAMMRKGYLQQRGELSMDELARWIAGWDEGHEGR